VPTSGVAGGTPVAAAAWRHARRSRVPIVFIAATFGFASKLERVARAQPVSADTATSSAATEFATYADSDHVTVFTPSIRLGVENVAGASLTGTYLVDVVSAASVDVVSTASSRWRELRQAGISADMDYLSRNLKTQLKQANRYPARYVAIIGEEETAQGKVTLKDMQTGRQELVAAGDLRQKIQAEMEE